MGRDGSGVRAISESSIEITFTYKGVRCREPIKLKPTPANLKRAANHRAAILDAIEKGSFDYAVTFPDSPRRFKFTERRGDVTRVATYLDDWLIRTEPRLKASTATDYRKTVNILVAQFGKLTLSELTRPAIRDWCMELDASNKRIGNLLSVLRQALSEAVTDGVLEKSPLYEWTFARKRATADDSEHGVIDVFTAEEQSAILAALDGQGRNLIQFAFWTGMRTSELVALEWRDVDWRRGVVMVRRAQTQAATQAKRREGTKTAAGTREIKLLPPAMSALVAQKPFTLLAGDRVFHNPRTDEPWTGDGPIRKTLWAPAIARAKVRYRYPYQTRHTFASMMLTAGESPMWVAVTMGHRDWAMIRRTYGRFVPDAIPDAGEKAVQMFATNPPDAQESTN